MHIKSFKRGEFTNLSSQFSTQWLTVALTCTKTTCSAVGFEEAEDRVTYLQVPGDGVVGSMRHHEDTVGLADQTVAHLDFPSMPVCDTSSHDGHAQ